MKPIPYTAEELIEELDKMYPHECPHINQIDRKIWMVAGRRELIDKLLVRLEKTKEEELHV
jgi:hypothetical protein